MDARLQHLEATDKESLTTGGSMTRDQFLTEMMGIGDEGYWWCPSCFMRKSPGQVTYGERCTYCCNSVEWNGGPDFTSPADAYRLMQFVMAAEWWCKFVEFAWGRCIFSEAYNFTHEAYFTKWLFSDPDRFAGLVAEYRGWRNE